MAGLSSIVNLGYHGTSPAIADAIATSGFRGGTVPTWAGKGNVFTSPNINVASRYGPSKLGVVTSAKNLTSPIGGGFNKSGISFGKEIVSNPTQATKGLNAFERMKLKYPNSPTFQRLLKTGTTAITNPTNWARLLGLPLSALTGILSSTPVNADEIEWQNMMNERWSKNYGPWTQGTLTAPQTRFKQQQLMNQRRLAMQQQIQQAEAIEAAKQKVTTGGPPSILSTPTVTTAKGPPSILSTPTVTTGGPPSVLSRPTPSVTTAKGPPSILSRPKPKPYVSPARPHGNGGGGGGGGAVSTGAGRNPWGRADGGLIDFYRYGGFIG